MGITDTKYRRPWWLRGAHAQTIWGRVMRAPAGLPWSSGTFTAPDGEALELHHLVGSEGAPHVLLLHGLEGSPRSHYVGGLMRQALLRHWSATLLVFRGCGALTNVAPRFYHSGETSDLDAAFAHLENRTPSRGWLLVGVSLGGNVLLKWLGESGVRLAGRVRAAAAISTPYDLEAGARQIARGRIRIYDRSFLRSLRRKALAKLERYPGLFARDRLLRAQSVLEFDDAVTAPVHGFADAHDYYRRSSAEQFLEHIRVPTLLVSAADDPFVPETVWTRVRDRVRALPLISADFPRHGGHVGFVTGRWPWRPRYYAEERVYEFFDDVLKR